MEKVGYLPHMDATVTSPLSEVMTLDKVERLQRNSETIGKSRKFLKFLGIATAIANLSKDPSTKVGCVAMDDNFNIRSVGYNGFPRGVLDLPERYNDRPTKYRLASHAEMNVVAQAARNGISLDGCTLILTALYPCSTCTKLLIQAGFKTLIVPESDRGGIWQEEWEISKQMLGEAGVDVLSYDPSNHSTISVIM